MHTSAFFKLFPPPRFMIIKYAGLDISDDAVRLIEYSSGRSGLKIQKYTNIELPAGVMEGGEIKNEKALHDILVDLEKKYNLSYVKVSISEEKAYLFQTDVPVADVHAIGHSIEFKLEENVPLSGPDAIFYFDLLPTLVSGGSLRASVSVVPRTYIEKYITLLRGAGISATAFEIVPKAIARAVVPFEVDHAVMVVHIMNKKTGVYIVSGGVVCFTSTIAWGSHLSTNEHTDITILTKEINRIYTYWMSHGTVNLLIGSLILVGRDSPIHENAIRNGIVPAGLPVHVADTWRNSLNINHYIPPISHEESSDYAVAAGLAIDG